MKTRPLAEDYSPLHWDLLVKAGAGVVAAATDIARHQSADGAWKPSAPQDDVEALAEELQKILQRLLTPIHAARKTMVNAERVARMHAANRIKKARRRSS